MPPVRRRHVFYVEGYDPQGAEGYYRIFARELKRFQQSWPVKAELSELSLELEHVARWTIETAAPNWQVTTCYDFLRLEHVVRGHISQPLIHTLPRMLRWIADEVFSGTSWRMLRVSWRFALHVFWLQFLALAWIAVSLGGGALIGWGAARFAGVPIAPAIAAGVTSAIAIFLALRPLADRWRITQVPVGWTHNRDFARGLPSGFDAPIETFAQRLVAAAGHGTADEIVVIGHSSGALLAAKIITRALELDPDLGRHGPRIALLTAASLVPAFALHPKAEQTRAWVRHVATEPGVAWVDCQMRSDVMNFWDIDPVRDSGIDVEADCRSPIVWKVRLHDMILEQRYKKMTFFRIHYQLVMGNDRRSPYEYFMLTCGPFALEDTARDPYTVGYSFGPDASRNV